MSSNKPSIKMGKEKNAAIVSSEGLLGSETSKKSAKTILNPSNNKIQKPPDKAISPLCRFLFPSGASTIPKLLKMKGPAVNTAQETIKTNK